MTEVSRSAAVCESPNCTMRTSSCAEPDSSRASDSKKRAKRGGSLEGPDDGRVRLRNDLRRLGRGGLLVRTRRGREPLRRRGLVHGFAAGDRNQTTKQDPEKSHWPSS